jgi:predicted nucleic acid-binding protein
MIRSTAKVICDAGPIIHLDELNCLDLLGDFHQVLLTETIRQEVAQHRPAALEGVDFPLSISAGKIPTDEPLLTLCRIFSLNAGETEAFSLLEANPQAIFLTDDASARLVAKQMGFKVHGTIGVLLRSIRRGQRQPEAVLNTLTDISSKSTLYIKPVLLDEILSKLKDEFSL